MLKRSHLLDGMRGMAALSVAGYHLAEFYGVPDLQGGYLAVDFFFMLSGLVIGLAYDRRMAEGMSASRFLTMRVIRLYPLFVLATVIGFGKAIGQVLIDQPGALSLQHLAIALPLNALMVPVPFASPNMFPLNGPLWSLFCEMLINVAYALLLVRLRSARLAAIVVIGAIGMLVSVVIDPKGINTGVAFDTLIFGLARVSYGFGMGMLIARHVRGKGRTVTPHAYLLVLLLLFFMIWSPAGTWVVFRDLIFVFICVPLIIGIGAMIEIPAPATRLFAFLGDLSFPLYAVHFPILLSIGLLCGRLGLPHWISGTIAMAAAIFVALLAARYYDQPVRAWLSNRVRLRESARAQILTQ